MTSQSVPATPAFVQDLRDTAFQQAVVHAAALMDRPEFTGRLQKAMDFVLSGAVTLQDDGTATVKSGAHTYAIAPECTCQDSQQRSMYCKHFLAVQLLKRTYERFGQRGNGNGVQRRQESPAATQETPQPQPWACVQAPSSCTLKWSVGGIELLLTLRDATDDALFSRIRRVLPRIEEKVAVQRQKRQAQADGGSGTGSSAGKSQPQEDEEPSCHYHDVLLKQYTKDGRSWYSHYDAATNAWCRGK